MRVEKQLKIVTKNRAEILYQSVNLLVEKEKQIERELKEMYITFLKENGLDNGVKLIVPFLRPLRESDRYTQKVTGTLYVKGKGVACDIYFHRDGSKVKDCEAVPNYYEGCLTIAEKLQLILETYSPIKESE